VVDTGTHRPGRNLTLAGACPPVTQTSPEICFLQLRATEETDVFNKEKDFGSSQKESGTAREVSVMSSVS
jgi:hypothetical protein